MEANGKCTCPTSSLQSIQNQTVAGADRRAQWQLTSDTERLIIHACNHAQVGHDERHRLPCLSKLIFPTAGIFCPGFTFELAKSQVRLVPRFVARLFNASWKQSLQLVLQTIHFIWTVTRYDNQRCRIGMFEQCQLLEMNFQ